MPHDAGTVPNLATRPQGPLCWNGENPLEIHDIKLTDTGFNISFTELLDQTQVNLVTVTAKRYFYP